MPNWCDNEVVITADDPKVLQKIMEIAPGEETKFSMENFVPTPDEFPESQSSRDWYDWRVNNWGTKWDLGEVYINQLGESISLGYSTAWSPNVNFWAEFSKLYPVKISHRYFEEGMCFIGEAEIENGKIDDFCVEIDERVYKAAGAILDADGNVDWEIDQEYNLYDVFPLRGY
jgi:hypothetical protein